MGEHRRGLPERLGALESFPAANLWFSEAIIKQGEAESFNQRMVGRTGRLHREGDVLLCHFLDEKTEALRVGSGQTVSQWLNCVRNPGLRLPIAAPHCWGPLPGRRTGSTSVHLLVYLTPTIIHFPYDIIHMVRYGGRSDPVKNSIIISVFPNDQSFECYPHEFLTSSDLINIYVTFFFLFLLQYLFIWLFQVFPQWLSSWGMRA